MDIDWPPPTLREALLGQAEDAVMRGRNQAYGDPKDNLGLTAQLLTVLFGHKLVNGEYFTAPDVALIMLQVKQARLVHTADHWDSWVDVAGWAACGAECAQNDP